MPVPFSAASRPAPPAMTFASRTRPPRRLAAWSQHVWPLALGRGLLDLFACLPWRQDLPAGGMQARGHERGHDQGAVEKHANAEHQPPRKGAERRAGDEILKGIDG